MTEAEKTSNRPTIRDYSEYWATHIVLVRILQSSGLKVDVRDRLPLFRLWNIVTKRMTGAKANNILKLLNTLVGLRIKGEEPPNDGKKYS